MSGAAQAEQILADPEANRRLLRDGFVVMPLVDASLARRLRTSFDELNPAEGSGFQSDLLSDDPAYRAAADGAIQLLDPAVEQLFVDRRAFLRSFLCKHPGEASELYLHRDWMYVDERSGARTYAVWVALEDITGHNGQLQVLRGSHELSREPRGTNLISSWLAHEDTIRPRLATIPVPEGHCVVFDNSLAHCSLPNNTSTRRVAAAVAVRDPRIPLVHFRRRDERTAERYVVNEEFFLDHTPQSLLAAPPALPVAEILEVSESSLGPTELAQRLDEQLLGRLDSWRNTAHTSVRRVTQQLSQGADAGRAAIEDRSRNARRALSADPVHRRLSALAERARAKAENARDQLPTAVALRVLALNEAMVNRFGPPSPAVWDPQQFQWSGAVEAAFSDIRDEVDALLDGPSEIPHIEDVVGGIPQGNEGPWRTFVLMHQGRWIDWNMARCPRTTDVVRQIPGLMMAGFSVLEPGTHITEHRGPNKGALRYQLGVRVPGPEGACRIRVGDEMLNWRDGESVMFDFTVPHEAWNDTDEIRVLLMLEVVTPLPWYLSVPNRLAQRSMGWFPTTRDMKARLKALEPSLQRHHEPAS